MCSQGPATTAAEAALTAPSPNKTETTGGTYLPTPANIHLSQSPSMQPLLFWSIL